MRYVTKPPAANWWEAPPQPLPHPVVYPSEAIKTGLLDPNGHDIYKTPDEVGFLRLSKGEKK
jgi:hypothetical protein